MNRQYGMVFISLVLILIASSCKGSKIEDEQFMPAAAPFHYYADVRFYKDVKYGPHELQAMDLYLVKSDKPTPLIIYIHGGGFTNRDRDKNDIFTDSLYHSLYQGFAAGISYASINYRLIPEVYFPVPHQDCARAVQFLRYHAKEFNLDPDRFACTGRSAGAGISMWLAFKDDMADPESDDPISRQSTRLTCIAVMRGQSSYDPYFAESIGLPRLHTSFLPFYKIKKDEIDSPRAKKLYDQLSAIIHVSSDDVPTLLEYNFRNEEVTQETLLTYIVHHPKFGIVLKEKLDELGIECILQYPGHPENDWITPLAFISKHFGIGKKEEE
jgi:carboxylesterase type B